MTHTPEDKTDHMNLDQFEKATKLLNPDWLDDASCQDMDTDMFFNYKETSGPSLAALKACQSCPVRKECLLTIAEFESNLNVNAGKGMFAGLTPTKRRKMYQTVAIKNYEEVSLEMLNNVIAEKISSHWTQSAYEIEKRAVAHRLAKKPNKRTQYCKLHNYPVVGLRSDNRTSLGKILMYACYHGTDSHYLYKVNNQILTREEYEELCAAQ
jgi:hypothetical protein